MKSQMWSQALTAHGLMARGLDGSPLLMPIKLVKLITKHGRPVGFFFRYLSDYPGLFKTVARLVAEGIVVCICKLSGTAIFWICHNVDRESTGHHPLLSRLRRRLIASVSRQIFVLDPLLVPYAREIFRAQADRIAFITFGVPPKRPLGHSSQQINRRIIEFCQSARGATTEPDRKVLIGVCVGQGGRKSAHFEFVLPLVNRAAAIGIDVYLIVGGEIVLPDSFLCDADIQALRCHPRIFFHSGPFDFDEGAVAGQVDFIFRGYRDLSVPYTLYIGAHSALPILALSMGFAAEAVTKYHLGVTLRPDFQDLGPALSCLQNWDTATGSSFLRSHTWDVAAKNLLAALDQHTFPFREPRNTP